MKSSKKKPGDGLGVGKLLPGIETINNALYLDKILSENSDPIPISRSKSVEKSHFEETTDKSLPKEKKSTWSWKNLISFTKNRRFNCCFSLEVHSIENLPSCFHDLELCVHWKRRENELATRLARVSEGVAHFEDHLRLICPVYGSESGPQQSAKYEATHFLIYTAVKDAPELDLGKHRVDLTRFLPLTLEELEDEQSSSKWSTSFRLSGMAKGARMNVIFGCSVAGTNISQVSNLKRNNSDMDQSDEIKSMICRTESLPDWSTTSSSFGEDIRDLHEVSPYHKVDSKSELHLPSDVFGTRSDFEKIEHENIEEELEEKKGQAKSEEISEMGNSKVSKIDKALDMSIEEDAKCLNTKESLMKDFDLALHNIPVAEMGMSSPISDFEKSEIETSNIKSDYKTKRSAKLLSLDDITNSVADEFLNMLEIEHSPFGLSSESEPESPRERLLRQFEKNTLASGCSLFGNDEFDLFQSETNIETESSKLEASMLEDLETEALMCEWGLNENSFVELPPSRSASPTDRSPEEPSQFAKTKNGGFLRPMNPRRFENAKSGGGGLVMQVSNCVVVPKEMGSSVMEVLKGLASVGIEKLSKQANKLMPFDDVHGLKAYERGVLLKHDVEVEHNLASGQKDIDPEFVSLEDLAPLAIDKIEALSIEGLKIQSDMSDDEAPSNTALQNIGERSLGLEGAAGLKLLDTKEACDDEVDNLMSLSLTLDEWLRIDSGEIDGEDGFSERTSKILAAHHACDSLREGSKMEKSCKKGGFLGTNFTVALLVQLRDPIRSYEPVGTPMLALIQVERAFAPPNPKLYSIVSHLRNPNKDDENVENKDVSKEKEQATRFKISEVHVAGLRNESGKKNIWGSKAQQQSGSRWLIANGMGKGKKPLALKSKAEPKSAFLWSVSARVKGNVANTLKELAKIIPHVRNPDIVLNDEIIKLR